METFLTLQTNLAPTENFRTNPPEPWTDENYGDGTQKTNIELLPIGVTQQTL